MNDMASPAPPPPKQAPPMFDAKQPITTTLEAQEWQVVFAGLNELPRRVSDAVFDKLMAQVQSAG